VSLSGLHYLSLGVQTVEGYLKNQYRHVENAFVHEIASRYNYVPFSPPPPARTWQTIADEQAEIQGLNKCLVRAVIAVESNNGKNMISPAGALGHMQLMPETAKAYGLRTDSDRLDPEQGIYAGAKHLKEVTSRYGLFKGLKVYNAGPNRVDATQENRDYPFKVLEEWKKCNA